MSDPQTVRWGVLGTARIATKVSSAINSTPGAELLAIGSRSLDRANQWAQQHGASQSYASYQEVLEDDRVAQRLAGQEDKRKSEIARLNR